MSSAPTLSPKNLGEPARDNTDASVAQLLLRGPGTTPGQEEELLRLWRSQGDEKLSLLEFLRTHQIVSPELRIEVLLGNAATVSENTIEFPDYELLSLRLPDSLFLHGSTTRTDSSRSGQFLAQAPAAARSAERTGVANSHGGVPEPAGLRSTHIPPEPSLLDLADFALPPAAFANVVSSGALVETLRVHLSQSSQSLRVDAPTSRTAASADVHGQTTSTHAPEKSDNKAADANGRSARLRHPEPGMVLGKCVLSEKIGEGGWGDVYRALHRGLNIPVALKILRGSALGVAGAHQKPSSDARLRKQLRTEARLLAQINHPNIVRVLDFDDDGPFAYLVMEFVDGPSLAGLLRTQGRLDPQQAGLYMLHIVDALKAARQANIVHRDIKPANILVSNREGLAKLADLGLARIQYGNTASAGNTRVGSDSGLDSGDHGGLLGTVAYMSPEHALDPSQIDFRSDVYSLGATFFHLITGRTPFSGRNRMEVLLKHAKENPPAPQMLVPDLNPTVGNIVLRMMAKRPEQRYCDLEELKYDLATALGQFWTGVGLSSASSVTIPVQPNSSPDGREAEPDRMHGTHHPHGVHAQPKQHFPDGTSPNSVQPDVRGPGKPRPRAPKTSWSFITDLFSKFGSQADDTEPK